MKVNERAFLFVIDFAGSNFRFTSSNVIEESFKAEELGRHSTEIDWDIVFRRAVQSLIIEPSSGDWSSLVFKGPDDEQLDPLFFEPHGEEDEP